MPVRPADPSHALLDVRDVLDSLWLATFFSASSAPASTPQPDLTGSANAQQGEQQTTAAGSTSTQTPVAAPGGRESVETPSGSKTGDGSLFAGGGHEPVGSQAVVHARPIRIPAGSALPNGLDLVRALRPLPARQDSLVAFELDEEATVEATAANKGRRVPVMRPRTERWFEAALVVDHSASAEIWAQTVVEIERLLAYSGTFRDVRTYRLQSTPTLTLSNESGTAIKLDSMRDPSARRIVFFFTPGVANAWRDGSYGRLLESWSRKTPVVILHALPRRLWPGTALGEPSMFVTNPTPGGPNIDLRKRRRRGMRARPEEATRIAVPVFTLDPEPAHRWAEMFMSRRGRSAPAYMLVTAADPERMPRTRPPLPVEQQVAQFEASAPDAFRLAVRLAVGAFTIPIAQLVQQMLFGRQATQAQIAELMLSGLVKRLTPMESAIAPEFVQFQFTPEATALLLRSLRRDDARQVSNLLQRYIQEHIGTTRDQVVLMQDPQGPLSVPASARPFAELNEGFADWLRASGQSLTPPNPEMATRRRIRVNQPLRLKSDDDARAVSPPPGSLGETFGRAHRRLFGVRILWVDDQPESTSKERSRLMDLGAVIDAVLDGDTALEHLQKEPPHLIISDMSRGDRPRAGRELLREVREYGYKGPFVFYVRHWEEYQRDELVQAEAFGGTNEADELIELVHAATADVQASHFGAEFGSRLENTDLADLRTLDYLTPIEAAQRVAEASSTAEARREMLVTFLAAATSSSYVQLFSFTMPDVLQLAASHIEAGLVTYDLASMTGVIGRAVTNRTTVWVPDTTREPRYIAAEPSTRSELAIPLMREDGTVDAVVNIERKEPDAFSTEQVAWLEAFLRSYPSEQLAPESGLGARGSGVEDTDTPDTAANPKGVLADLTAIRNGFVKLSGLPPGLMAAVLQEIARLQRVVGAAPATATLPAWELRFDQHGQPAPHAMERVIGELTQHSISDLFLFVHGWNADRATTQDMRTDLTRQFSAAASQGGMAMNGFAVLGVTWPAIAWDDTEAIPERIEAFATQLGRNTARGALRVALGQLDEQPDDQYALARLRAGLTAIGVSSEDAARVSTTPFDTAAEDTPDTPSSSGSGLGGLIGGIWQGAKGALRSLSFYQMRDRAKHIGSTGLGPVLVRLSQQLPDVRIHIVAHSVGCRLAGYGLKEAASRTDETVHIGSVTFIQPILPHYVFTDAAPGSNAPGAMAAAKRIVRGPFVVTYSHDDTAARVVYLTAMRTMGGDTDAPKSEGPAGAAGSEGAQGVGALEGTLGPVGTTYALMPGRFTNVDASKIITGHSDFLRPEVAWLILSAATGRAHASSVQA